MKKQPFLKTQNNNQIMWKTNGRGKRNSRIRIETENTKWISQETVAKHIKNNVEYKTSTNGIDRDKRKHQTLHGRHEPIFLSEGLERRTQGRSIGRLSLRWMHYDIYRSVQKYFLRVTHGEGIGRPMKRRMCSRNDTW